MARTFTHIAPDGSARMVDVGSKRKTRRVAVASALVRMKPGTLGLIQSNRVAKGNVLEVARIAAITAAKETHRLIPLCHPLALTHIEVTYRILKPDTIHIQTRVEATDKTGVEMEALTAVAICGLTIYDMCKAVDKNMTIESVKLLEKKGGRSGHFVRRD